MPAMRALRSFRLLKRKSFRIFLFLVAAALLAEFGLRVAGHFYLASFYRRQYEALPGGVDPINIVCLGESSTVGLWVDWEDSYPKQLETMLRSFYGTNRIRVIVPVHVGQNSSQVANRINDYIDLYHPRLVVAMVGYNNEWSLAESHIGRFLPASTAGAWKVRSLVALDEVRLFKVFRYVYHALSNEPRTATPERDRLSVLGHPELVRYPPEDWVYSFARSNQPAFVELWKHDVRQILRAARARHIESLLMTYHINPTYLSSREYVSLAGEEKVSLVRNDSPFESLIRKGTINRYLLYDHWHPNRYGYAIIARDAFEQITQEDLLGLGTSGRQPTAPVDAQEAEQFPMYPEEAGVVFADSGIQAFLGGGWSGPEGPFRWTDSLQAEVLFAVPDLSAKTLELRMQAFVFPGRLNAQRLRLTLNGQEIANLSLKVSSPQLYALPLPAGALQKNNVLRLETPDADSPLHLGISKDSRRLGVALERIGLRR